MDYEFVYMTEGVLEVTIGGRSTVLHSGESCLIFPNEIHSYRNIEKARAIVHVFSGDVVGEFNRRNYKLIPEKHIFTVPHEIMEQYCRTFLEQHESNHYIAKGYLYIFLGVFTSQVTLRERVFPNMSVLDKIFSYIAEHFKENITLTDVARSCKYEPQYLSNVLSQYVKINFKRIVNSYRLDYANHLLNTTKMSMTDIALASGFSNVRSFNRAFLIEYGISPREYKKNGGNHNHIESLLLLGESTPANENQYNQI